jgi:hypothetical protein
MLVNRTGEEVNLKDTYKGSSVFLFGGGRSITPEHIKLSRTPGIISASLNEGGHYIRPNIYMSTSGITLPYSVLNDASIMKFVNIRHWDKPVYEDRERNKLIKDYPNVFGMKMKPAGFSDFYSDDFIFIQEQRTGKYAKNSAITFINLLVKLGFRRIYLVGMDFYQDTNNCTYFYERSYINTIKGDLIGKVKDSLKQLGQIEDVKIYNTNKRSGLDFFKYKPLEQAIKQHSVYYKHDICDDFSTERVVWGLEKIYGYK